MDIFTPPNCKKKRKYTNEQYLLVRDLRCQGFTVKDISIKTGLNKSIVYLFSKDIKVKTYKGSFEEKKAKEAKIKNLRDRLINGEDYKKLREESGFSIYYFSTLMRNHIRPDRTYCPDNVITHNKAKLSVEEIRAIRNMHARGLTIEQIAEQYDGRWLSHTKTQIRKIITKQNYAKII